MRIPTKLITEFEDEGPKTLRSIFYTKSDYFINQIQNDQLIEQFNTLPQLGQIQAELSAVFVT
jgi:hypothetical protein